MADRPQSRSPARARPEAAGPLGGRGPPRPPGCERQPSGSPLSEPQISAADRWRLILGQEREKLARSALPAAIALDELYGRGRGGGARGRGSAAGGSGFPSVRTWAEELEALFGKDVREEVLGRAAGRGQTAAALEVDAAAVTQRVGRV